MKQGYVFFIKLSILLTLSIPSAFSNDFKEDAFLQSRIRVATSYSETDEEDLSSILADQRFMNLEVEAKNFLRDTDVYLATRGTIKYLSALSGLDKLPLAVSFATRFPKLATFGTNMVPTALINAIGHFKKSDGVDDITANTNVIIASFIDNLDRFSLSSPDANLRLQFHQASFREFLTSRAQIDRLFDQKIQEINPAGLSIANFWSYGKNQEKFYALQTLRLQAQVELDAAEGDYLDGAALKLASIEAPEIQ